MDVSLSDDELACIALLLDENDTVSKKRKRKWIHPILKNRKTEGEYWTLFKDLSTYDDKFFQYFRMTQCKFYYLLRLVEPTLQKQNTRFREAISPMEKLTVCLRFLATGDSFRTIATSYRLGHSTVQGIVIEVCEVINEKLMPLTMPTPTKDHWKNIATEFWDHWNFPNCLGALDGKHVVIQAPPNSGSQFFNYKKTFSIVLLALVDAHYRFVAVDIGGYGKNSDGGLFANSRLGKALESNKLNVPEDTALPNTRNIMPHVIVGDEAFPLKTYLLRPYPGSQIQGDVQKRIFTYRLSRARRVSENAFGILSQKFRIYNRRLQLKPENADRIILATCVLHNYLRDCDINIQDNVHNHGTDDRFQNLPRQGGSATSSAFTIRDAFKDFFVSEHGRIEWQDTIT